MKKNLYIKTYGCQMNVYDSLRMQDLMLPLGYVYNEELEVADLIILNTCHIREKAAEKVYSELGRINKIKEERKASGRKLVIAVSGCVSQAEGDEIFRRAPYVDIVVGPQSYHNLPDMVARVLRDEVKHAIELDFIEEAKFDLLPEPVQDQGASAFVSVQEGCDKFCTFCVVSYTRGAEFSRPLEQVYREIMQHVSRGAKEIVLLGQNVNAYHGIKEGGIECNFAELILRIASIKSIERIRYTTSHPIDMNDQLIELHGMEPKLMPYLHLPVQSGSNAILKAMNRKYSREHYFEIIDKLRKYRSDIALSSDFIVGFPGETDKDFEDTLDLVKRVKYSQCYSFKYSPRPGTPAAIRQQIPEYIKAERLKILQEELSRQQMEFNLSSLGTIMPVLFDREGKHSNQIIGKSPYMQSVHINDAHSLLGKIVNVKIIQARPSSLAGELIENSLKKAS